MALKESVIDMIQKATWPDQITKKRALSKAQNLRPNLVAPPMYFNKTFLESVAAEVKPRIDHFLRGKKLYDGIYIDSFYGFPKVNVDGLDFVASTWELYQLFRREFFDIYNKPVDETTVT